MHGNMPLVVPFLREQRAKVPACFKEKTMYVMIDNFDSFVYNLKAYFQEIGREVLVKRCDRISLQDLEELQP